MHVDCERCLSVESEAWMVCLLTFDETLAWSKTFIARSVHRTSASTRYRRLVFLFCLTSRGGRATSGLETTGHLGLGYKPRLHPSIPPRTAAGYVTHNSTRVSSRSETPRCSSGVEDLGLRDQASHPIPSHPCPMSRYRPGGIDSNKSYSNASNASYRYSRYITRAPAWQLLQPPTDDVYPAPNKPSA